MSRAQTCRRAGEDPGLGRDRADLGPGVHNKVVLESSYLIYFRAARPGPRAGVQIARILQQAREVERASMETTGDG